MSVRVRMEKRERARIPWWVSWLIYIALSLIMTWPLARHLHSHLHGNNQDIFNVYWGNWWVPKALAAGRNPYVTDYLIYPVGFDLTTFAFSPFLALLAMPVAWITSPVVAYNVTVWATIVLCCGAMDQLVRYLTRDPWAALVAGITFGFAPALAAMRLARLNMAMVAWIPWTALLIARLTREARTRDALLLAVTVGLSFLTRLQTGALVLLFCGVYFLGLALAERRGWPKGAARRLLLAGLLACLFLSPLFVHVWRILNQPGGENLMRPGIDDDPTDLLSYVVPLPQHPLFGPRTDALYGERLPKHVTLWTFVGWVPLALSLYALASRPKDAWPWLLSGLFFLLLALGPHLRLNGETYPGIRLPFHAAQRVLAVVGLEKPNRFNLALMSALAVLVGLASAQISARLGRSWPLPILGALILFEYLVLPMPLMDLAPDSPFYAQIAADGEDYALVDLPLAREEGEMHRYYQTLHHKRIVGGWDHRVPASAFAFIDGNPLLRAWAGRERPDQASQEIALEPALAELSRANVRYIVLHKEQLESVPPRLQDLFLALPPAYEDGSVYVLPTGARPGQARDVVPPLGDDTGAIQPSIQGRALPVAPHAPLGVLGYSVAGRDDTLWVALGWQSLADPGQPYVLSAQLLDLASGRKAAPSDEVVGPWEGGREDRAQARAIRIPDELPQGEYRLSVRVRFPGGRGAAPEVWSEHRLALDVPILVLPATLKDRPISEEGRVVVYTAATEGMPARPQHRVEVRFGDLARLSGYSLAGQRVVAGGDLDVTLYWEAVDGGRPAGTEPSGSDYKVFVHLLNERGEIVAQHDGEPAAGRRPTHTWRSGDMILDRHELAWQTRAVAGPATLAVGLYDFQTHERLPAYGPTGERLPYDRAILRQVEVE